MEKFPEQSAFEREPTPKELLHELEKSGRFIFHGSSGRIERLDPKQPLNWNRESKKMEPDGKPAVCASQFSDVAIFHALTKQEFPLKNYDSGFSLREEGEGDDKKLVPEFDMSENLRQYIKDHRSEIRGFVHVMDCNGFYSISPMEARSEKSVVPDQIIEVGIDDLPDSFQL